MFSRTRTPLSFIIITFILCIISSSIVQAEENTGLSNYQKYEERIEWFKEAKFGIFIHWGLYAQVGYTEWSQNHFEIQADEYSKLMDTFNPVNYNPVEWADIFKDAGANYVVITSKHHEGFSMYDTKYSDYSIINSPYQKDIIEMLETECVKNDLKFGIYYSVMDWHHNDYLPRRYFDKRPTENADPDKYKIFFKNQIAELIDKFNPLILWFDGEWENTHDSLETVDLVNMMLSKNPSLIFNNRLSRFGYGDFKTPENQVPPTGLFNEDGTPQVWETCSTMGDSWGYDPYADYFYSSRDLIRMLIDVCSKGGNLLLNVGPTPEGEIRPEHKQRLKDIGKWLSVYGESIYGTQASIFERLPFYGKSTTKGNVVYLHVFLKPSDNILRIPLHKNEIKSVSLIDGQKLDYCINNEQIQVSLPEIDYDKNAFVVKVEMKDKPEVKSYMAEYASEETITFDGASAEIYSETNHSIEKAQYYDKILVKNWNKDNSDIKLKWDFKLKSSGNYSLSVKCANANELTGEVAMICSIDSTNLEFQVIEKPRWTATNKLLYEAYSPGQVFLEAGEHTVYLKAEILDEKQAVIFQEIKLIPVQ